MKGSVSAVIFSVVFQINSCFASYHFVTNVNEDNLIVSCLTTKQCQEVGLINSTCVDNVCTCKDKKMCQKSRLKKIVTRIGYNCTEISKCNIENSFCDEGKCQCDKNTVSSIDKRVCLNVSRSLGLPCEEDAQCTLLNAICKDKQCDCSSNMHSDKGICFKSIGLGFSCERDEECSHTDFSSCTSNKCTCDKKHVKSETSSKCLLKAKYLTSLCSENIQCTSVLGPGSRCSKGFCICTELFQYKAEINQCVMDALLGELCGSHSDCHQPGGGESRLECILGVCKCKSAYFEDEGVCVLNSSNKYWRPFNLQEISPAVFMYIIVHIYIHLYLILKLFC